MVRRRSCVTSKLRVFPSGGYTLDIACECPSHHEAMTADVSASRQPEAGGFAIGPAHPRRGAALGQVT
jgi:hypothetical protein